MQTLTHSDPPPSPAQLGAAAPTAARAAGESAHRRKRIVLRSQVWLHSAGCAVAPHVHRAVGVCIAVAVGCGRRRAGRPIARHARRA
eukprot:344341-Chlamydomonas_euryale.AAC.1